MTPLTDEACGRKATSQRFSPAKATSIYVTRKTDGPSTEPEKTNSKRAQVIGRLVEQMDSCVAARMMMESQPFSMQRHRHGYPTIHLNMFLIPAQVTSKPLIILLRS